MQGSVAQTILLLAFISIVGLALGRIKVGGVSLGGGFVFFAAIATGHFASRLGIQTCAPMMELAKNFGLVVFVYTLGLQCGPGFFSSLRKGGGTPILSCIAVIVIGTALTLAITLPAGLSVPQAIGLLSGSVTNTPALISAQQTVLDLNPAAVEDANDVGAAYAVAYPFSILGAMLCIMIMNRMFPSSLKRGSGEDADKYTGVTEVRALNEQVCGKTVAEIVRQSRFHFVISRLWRDGKVQIPLSDTLVHKGDHLLIICNKDDLHRFGEVFGYEEDTDWNRPDIDWNIIDGKLVSQHIRVTRDDVIGISMSQLKIRNKFGVNITRINRAGITIIPSASTTLQFGDRLTVVGDENKIKALGKAMGNEEQKLNDPKLIPILTGIFLGVLLGSIPISLPGISTPLKLGIAGGPIIVGILMGAFGYKLHLTTYTTRSANLMLRQMGITFFFASLGFSVGGGFVETVLCLQGLKWAALSLVIAMVPMLLVGIFNEKVLRMDYTRNVGLVCGSMCNPNALNYACSTMGNDSPAEAYATVYPLTIFIRVFISQILVIILS